MEAIKMFDQILINMAGSSNIRIHKELGFVRTSKLPLEVIIQEVTKFLETNLNQDQGAQFVANIKRFADEESCLCECIKALIEYGKLRIEQHRSLFQSICTYICQIKYSNPTNDLLEQFACKCCLMIYDRFPFLCDIKRALRFVASNYRVPYLYECEEGSIKLRRNMVCIHNNLNTTIDDLQILNSSLWFVRNWNLVVHLDWDDSDQ